MILHPIIDLLKRIVVALPDYGGGGGELPEGMTNTGSGEIIFASRTVLNTPIDLGVDFTPKFVLIWTTETIGNGNLFWGGAVRLLTDSTGSFRYGYCISSPYEQISYYSSDTDFFINGETLNMSHGARYYAPATYYWFAFD